MSPCPEGKDPLPKVRSNGWLTWTPAGTNFLCDRNQSDHWIECRLYKRRTHVQNPEVVLSILQFFSSEFKYENNIILSSDMGERGGKG